MIRRTCEEDIAEACDNPNDAKGDSGRFDVIKEGFGTIREEVVPFLTNILQSELQDKDRNEKKIDNHSFL